MPVLNIDRSEDANGFAFAQAISDAVIGLGPRDLEYVEKIEMAEAITAFAVQWVKSRNVAKGRPQ